MKKLRPVTYQWDLDKLDTFEGREPLMTDAVTGEAREAKERLRFSGCLAQDVERAASECNYEFSGVLRPQNEHSAYALSYAST